MMEKRSDNGGGAATKAKKSSPSSKKAADPRTLFVKFDPPSASITRQHLSDHFSNYGPVNRCSVIRHSKPRAARGKGGGEDDGGGENGEGNYDRGSRGYGFVRFVNEEDAIGAADAIRGKRRQRGRKGGGGEVMVVDGVKYTIHAERAVDAAASSSSRKKGDDNDDDDEEETPVAAAEEEEDAAAATASYKAESKRKRTSRVILRNLSFYANEKHVKVVMEREFGPVAAVDLPLVPDVVVDDDDEGRGTGKKNKKGGGGGGGKRAPRHRGFAFVTFTNADAARRAVERGGEVSIKNRAVAIDYSVSKNEHRKMMKEEEERDGGKDDGDEQEEDVEEDGDDAQSESGSGGGGSSDSSDGDGDGGSSDSSSDDDGSDSDSEEGGDADDDGEDSKKADLKAKDGASKTEQQPPKFDENEANRTLFLRNVPFDAKRHDVFELFREFGRIEAVHLVKDRQTGVFKGTAFVRFEKDAGCAKAMEASGGGAGREEGPESGRQQFISSKNMAMGLGEGEDGGAMSSDGLTLKGRRIFVDLAVDRTTASSLAVQRDADGKPIKRVVGKDRRNLYLKNEGRVSSTADGEVASGAGAKHGGTWEDLPPGDRAKRERAFADKSTKLRSPLFFINPYRISVRNLSKHVGESELKKLVFGALKAGLEQKLATPRDAVAHWRASGELSHNEIMKRATDPDLVVPPVDDKNVREVIPSVYIDRDVSGGKKTADAPSRGFGFVEFTHHAHALAVLRQLNNNPIYSAEYAAGGKHAAEMLKHKRGGKKGKKTYKADPETEAEFISDDGKVCAPRLIVEFTAENKVKAKQQMEKLAQKKANKIKQRIEKKEKLRQEPPDKTKVKKKGRGALQREKKRARKEAGEGVDTKSDEGGKESATKKQKLEDRSVSAKQEKPKKVKPQKKRKVDKDDEALEDMIRSYKSTFGSAAGKVIPADEGASEPKKETSRERVVKKRWFE